MIKFDFFESIKHVQPSPRAFTYEQFVQNMLYFDICETKNDRRKCFSFTQYLPGRTRGKENIKSMTGLVFDFDNKDCEPIPINEVIKVLETKNITYLWYHTFSHTEEHLKWRLIIPFCGAAKIEEWDDIYERGFELIGKPWGIDPVSQKSAQVYFYPYQPAHTNTLFRADSFHGDLLSSKQLNPKIKKPKRTLIIQKPLQTSAEKLQNNITFKIERALSFISADVDYIEWIKVGMALKNELGESGFSIWDRWSSGGTKYKGQKETNYRWSTFNGNGVTIGSVYSMAKDRGLKLESLGHEVKEMNRKLEIKKRIVNVTVFGDNEDLIEVVLKKLEKYVLRNIFEVPCSVMMELFEWLNKSSYIVQPVYSLAACLSIIGFLKRNTIISPTSIRTNLYICVMGPSRSGKNNGLIRIYQILKKLKLENFLVSGIGSHQGLLRQMNENKGALFINNDEISYLLGNVQNKNSSSHEKNIEQKLLSLYNCKFQTTDAIKGDKVEKVDDPFLHIYSTTTEQIVDVLKPHSATSGLLARFLIFQVLPGMPYKENTDLYDDVPLSLITKLEDLKKENVIRKAIFEDDASAWFKQFREAVRPLQQELNREKTKVDSLLGNIAEQAVKLALLTAPLKKDVPIGIDKKRKITTKWPYIRLDDIQWGVAVAYHCLKNNIAMASTFSENPHEKVIKKIKTKIKERTREGKWISKSDLYKMINSEVGIHVFEGILKFLHENNEIDIEKNKKSRGYRIQWNSVLNEIETEEIDKINETIEMEE